jgi:phytoene synthase
MTSKGVGDKDCTVKMLERRKPLDLLFPLKGGATSNHSAGDKKQLTTLDRLRAGVTLARDTVKAVSVTAMEAIREGATYIGIVGEADELVDPFSHLDAPIWSQSPPAELLKLAYRYCEELTMREAGNFYHSFKYLPDEQRSAMCAVYAFCRRADDIADGDWADKFPGGMGETDPEAVAYREQLESLQQQGTILDKDAYLNKITQLFFFRKKLSTAYTDVYSTDPVFLALKDTINRYSIPRTVFDDLISGMEDDLYNNRYRTFDELYVYCYRVASVVGLMCIEIYGYEDPAAKKYAESWGIFMQLTNVLRDVGEDIARDRVYLPLNELESNGLTESELDGKVVLNMNWEPYCAAYAKRARTYLNEARKLLPLLPRRTRYSPAAMIAFYDKILHQIEKQQGDVFTKRVKLNKIQKISLAAAVYIRHRILPEFLNPIWTALSKLGILPAV